MRSVFGKVVLAACLQISAAVVCIAAEIVSLPLHEGANSYFRDDSESGGRPGWTGQVANDLRAMTPGKLEAAKVPFTVSSDADGKSCIVLGGRKRADLPQKTLLPVNHVSGECLYLLHASAFSPAPASDKKATLPLIGKLTVNYADGSSQETRIRYCRDVNDWWSKKSYGNAICGWTQNNGSAPVSLFVSRFKLKGNPIKSISFDSSSAIGMWMIAAVSVGDNTEVKLNSGPKLPAKEYSGKTMDPEIIASLPHDGIPRNIIMIIGDGMGQGCLDASSLAAFGETGKLIMQQLPVKTRCSTHSKNFPVTDSAAAATALSGGYKTNNAVIGQTADGKKLSTVAEAAKQSGKSVGILTTDKLSGATPAAYYAHVPNRGMAEEIIASAPASAFDIMIGNSMTEKFCLSKEQQGSRNDARNILSEFNQAGYQRIASREELKNLSADKKAFGFMSFKNDDFVDTAAVAFERLNKNPKGFFMMVECSYPDGGGHYNDPDFSINGGLTTDFLVKTALEFAAKNPDTLILVTADHECGGLRVTKDEANPRKPQLLYRSMGHSALEVPFFATGPGSKSFDRKLDNVNIPKAIAELWEFKEILDR